MYIDNILYIQRYKDKNVELIEDSIRKYDDDDDSYDCIAIDE